MMGFGISVEPIIGFERVQKLRPTAHTTQRLTYGARLLAGIPLVSLEAEVTRGQDEEQFPAQALTIKDRKDKLKLGARTSLNMGTLLRLLIRAGAQASRNLHTEILGGVTTESLEPFEVDPYAGLGLDMGIGRSMRANVTVTTVFAQWPDMSKNEYEVTAGFSIRYP